MEQLFIFCKLRNRLIGLRHLMEIFISSFIQILDSSMNIELELVFVF